VPRLRHIFERPEVASVRSCANGAVEVRVTGLACNSLCVRRTESALRGLPGVTDVAFTPDPDRFLVTTNGVLPEPTEMARAVRSMVVAFWVRRLIAGIAERVRRRRS
jgi:hypothetical protein